MALPRNNSDEQFEYILNGTKLNEKQKEQAIGHKKGTYLYFIEDQLVAADETQHGCFLKATDYCNTNNNIKPEKILQGRLGFPKLKVSISAVSVFVVKEYTNSNNKRMREEFEQTITVESTAPKRRYLNP